jgi:hypothetical protein
LGWCALAGHDGAIEAEPVGFGNRAQLTNPLLAKRKPPTLCPSTKTTSALFGMALMLHP